MPGESWLGRWECTTDGHNKFYEIHVDGRNYECTYGKIGTDGAILRNKNYAYVSKKVEGFRAKGYRQVSHDNVSRSNSSAHSSTSAPTPKPSVPEYNKSRLASIDDEDEHKPVVKEVKKDNGRLGAI